MRLSHRYCSDDIKVQKIWVSCKCIVPGDDLSTGFFILKMWKLKVRKLWDGHSLNPWLSEKAGLRGLVNEPRTSVVQCLFHRWHGSQYFISIHSFTIVNKYRTSFTLYFAGYFRLKIYNMYKTCMGKSMLFFNILYSFETSLFVNTWSLIWVDAQFLCWDALKVCYQPLLGRKATDAPWAASETTDQPSFTLLTGQKTGWASVSFKLKPVTGMLSLPVISVVRRQSEDFLSSFLIILVSVTSETPISSFAVHPLTRWNFSYFGFCQKAF